MPRCTIVIPTHNRPTLLPRAVASALRACPDDGEIVVVDDQSQTPATEVLNEVLDPRLRIIRNTKAVGAALARNQGVNFASGDIIFFLDDDDEMLEAHCHRVLCAVEVGSSIRWGFSSIFICSGCGGEKQLLKKIGQIFPGKISAAAQVRNRIAGMGEGFWINKELFVEIGGLDPQQSIDEDTDLCMRLIGLHIDPWYEPRPGIVVYRDYVAGQPTGAQLTVATPSQRGLECYRHTYEKNARFFPGFSAERWFLGTRFVRRAVKQQRPEMASDFVRQVEPVLLRCSLTVFFELKKLIYRIRQVGWQTLRFY